MIKQTGQCLCGDIQYEVTEDAIVAFFCHCRDCQKSGGSLFHMGVAVPKTGFKVTTGEPSSFEKQSDAGNTIIRKFCSRSGSGLWNELPDFRPDFIIVKAGTLDDPNWVKPARQVWTQNQSSWVNTPYDLETFETQPPQS